MNPLSPHLKQYLSLAEFFDQLGKQKFAEWTGQEVTADETVSYNEAMALRAELDAKTVELSKQVKRSDANYVDHLIRQNEVTGDLDFNPPLRKLVYRLDVLHSYFRTHPPLENRGAYEAAYSTFVRRQAIIKLIRELLAQEVLQAYESGEEGRREVPGDVWGSRSIRFDLRDGSVSVGSRTLVNVSIRFDDARRIVSTLAGKPVSGAPAEKGAQQALIQMMTEQRDTRRSKAAVWEELKGEFPGLSERGFDRIWAQACGATGSGWNKAGRPRGAASAPNQRTKSPRNHGGN